MTKFVELITMISGAAFAASLVFLMFFYSSSQPATEAPSQEHGEKYETKRIDHGSRKTLFEKAFDDPVAMFTLWLVVFTAVLSGVGVLQIKMLLRAETVAEKSAQAAKNSANVATVSLTTTQRAFVFVSVFETYVVNNELRILPKWENTGATPANPMRTYDNWKTFVGRHHPIILGQIWMVAAIQLMVAVRATVSLWVQNPLAMPTH